MRVRARIGALVVLGSVVATGVGSLVAVHPAAAAGTPSVTTISSNRSTTRVAQPITLTAHVTGAGSTPAGTVSFATGAVSLGSAPLVSGTATLNIASLTEYLNSGVIATYSG